MEYIQRVVPVLDVKDGQAVGAKQGERETYEPLESEIVNSTHPLHIAQNYRQMGFESIYIADLDGIMYSSPNIDLLKEIRWSTHLEMMVDIGTWFEQEVMTIELSGITPVLATESFTSLNLLRFPRDFILSLDIKEGDLKCGIPCDLDSFIELIGDCSNIKKVLIVDLDRVGAASGPNLDLCGKVLSKLPNTEIIYGGGIRFLVDVAMLLELGVHQVLVGSALHEGRITLPDLYKTYKE